ncbi:MAG: hypothetical protein JSS63_09085 [Bacteroidetes bacterium]|nr:hypothetical protein [Bacteroidota bacterium]
MLSKKSKIALLLICIAGIFWLGAVNIRFFIGNQLLNYDEFNFRTSIPPDEENQIFQAIANCSLTIMIAYSVVLISAITFVKSSKINLKENPWFLMCCILFFAFVPVELYTSYIDLKFVLLFNTRPSNHDVLLKLFGERIGFLKGVPWIAVLSYYTIIGICIFQPLKKSKTQLDYEKNKAKEHSYKYIFHEEDDLIIDEK